MSLRNLQDGILIYRKQTPASRAEIDRTRYALDFNPERYALGRET